MQHSSSILVVDDDQDIRFFLEEALEDAGYRVVTAANGLEAMAGLQQHTIHAILLDLWMPEVNGITFLQQLHELPEPHPPIILMTAGKLDDLAEFILQSAGVLTKPFELNDLYTCVEQVLKGTARTVGTSNGD